MGQLATAAQHLNTVDLVCCTYHFNRGAEYEEVNPGILYSRWISQDLAITGGYYHNSEGTSSQSIGFTHKMNLNADVAISLGMGFVAGYKRGLSPYILPSISYKRVNFIIIPLPKSGGVNLSIRALEW